MNGSTNEKIGIGLFKQTIKCSNIVSHQKKKISYIKTFSKKKFNKKNSKFFIFKIYYDFISFLDARARSIDFLLLILFIDRCGYFDLSVFLVLILFLIVFRELIIYLAGIYKSYKEYEKI